MPGIAGIIHKGPSGEGARTIKAMIGCMDARGFYRSGTYVNDGLGLQVGWVSEKDSFSDGMPVWNENKDICLIFSGEDAADESDIRRLNANGHAFAPDHASYLVHLYEEGGMSDFSRSSTAAFSGIVVDLRKRKAILFNDRYGLNRIYLSRE